MPIYTVDDSQDPPRYHLQIQTLVSELMEPSPQAQVEEYLKSLKKRDAKFTVLVNEPWIHSDVLGHYLLTKTDLGEGIVAVQGWLILQTGPFDFLVFNSLSSGVDFETIAPALEASFRTIGLENMAEMAAARTARLRRGYEILQSITPEKLKSLCSAEPRLYRVWQTDDRGQEHEVGYYRVSVRGGTLSDASNDADGQESGDPTGILVTVQGRTIVDSQVGRFADMDARFWCAWDRSSEVWSSRITERGGKKAPKSIAQTGVRPQQSPGAQRQILTVIDANAQTRTRDEKSWTVPIGLYLSQAETLVLGELLPRVEKQDAVNFAYYAFDPRSNGMPQRVENWMATSTGGWVLVTQPGLDEAAEITTHDDRGRRVRRTEPGGFMTEWCLPRQLEQIWSEKGLPTR